MRCHSTRLEDLPLAFDSRPAKQKRIHPRSQPGIACLAILAALSFLSTSPLLADDILPFSEVKVGMKGEGRSVFQGNEIARFNAEVIGLMEVKRHTSPRGSKLVFFKAPGSDELIEICQFDASGPVIVGPDLTHLAFEVDDLEAFAKHAASRGFPLSDGPTPTGSGSVIAFIDAPEGYEIELIQPGRQ